MTYSNFTICYEGIQRTYRNALVGHIRAALVLAFNERAQEQLHRPFKQEEWDTITRNASTPRNTGVLDGAMPDDFDLLSVNHFFNLFECHYDILCPNPKKTEQADKAAERRKLLEWIRTIKELRDPTSHPPEQDLSYEDSFVLLDCARRTLLRLSSSDAAGRIHELMGALSGRPLAQVAADEPLEANLPPHETIVIDFVGRETELRALWDWLSNPLSRRWALSGAGGKGKTAVAYQFACDVRAKAPEPLQVVLWLSAKKRRFEEGTTKPIPTPDFTDLDTALTQLLIQYGWTEDATGSIESKRARALQLLDKFPALIVVDDIDSVEQSAEDAIEFFSLTVPQTQSKVLFTSRRVLWGMGNTTTQIGGFGEADAARFIDSRLRLMELDPAPFTKQTTKKIVEATEGSPLYIEDLMRLMTVLPTHEAIRTWMEKGGHEARSYALSREMDKLSHEARFVLVAACVSTGPVSFAELQAVTGLSQDIVTDALRQLQGLFLVSKPRLIEGESRFEINVNVRSLVLETNAKSELLNRAIAAHKAIAGELPRARRADVGAIIRQAVFMMKSGDDEPAEQFLNRALVQFPNDPDLLGVLGWIYRKWNPPRYTDAKNCFLRSYQLNNRNAEMYQHWSRMEIDLHDWPRAVEAAERGIEKNPTAKQLHFLAGYARSRHGQEMETRMQTISAQDELVKALRHLERAKDLPDGGSPQERDTNRQIYRAIVITAAKLNDRSILQTTFDYWFKEHPDDPNAQTEWERLSPRFRLLRSGK